MSGGAPPHPKDEWAPIVPVPADAPPMRYRHPEYGEPAAAWGYRNAAGERLMYVARFQTGEPAEPGKEYVPITYCENPSGRRSWRAKGLPVPRPLFGLERLAARPEDPVLVCEGEKSASAAAERFREFVGITSPGGARAAVKADWTPLRGRRVVIWPDADAPGRQYAGDVARLALAATAASVAIVSVPDTLPVGWDLGDALPEGWDYARLRELLERAAPPEPEAALPSARQSSVEELLTSSGLAALPEGAALPAVEEALRALAGMMSGADPLRRAMVREAVKRRLTLAGVSAAAGIADAALGAPAGAAADDAQGTALALADPVPWPEPVDGAELLDAIAAVFTKYVALPDGGAETLALWVAHAHALEASFVSPLLVLSSAEKRSGKTRCLEILEGVAPRALFVSNVSASALFRIVEEAAPTLLCDETDAFMREDEALRGLLNSGHTRAGAFVVRCTGEEFEPRRFSTWAAKALAGIGRLPETIEDRALILRMRRRAPGETIAKLRRDRLPAELEPLKRKAARWTADRIEELRAADPAVPEGLHDRAADNSRPLLALAEAAGGDWPERGRRAVAILAGAAAEEDGSLGVLLLGDLRQLFADRGADRLSSGAIVEALGRMEDRPWPEYRHARPLTARQLAARLKPFGIVPSAVRLDDGSVLKGYRAETFTDAWERYLPPVGGSGSVTALQVNAGAENPPFLIRYKGEGVTDRESAENARPRWLVTPVTDPQGEVGAEAAPWPAGAALDGRTEPCRTCRGRRFWWIPGGPLTCARCHPPARPEAAEQCWLELPM